jgi:hypothetical protein
MVGANGRPGCWSIWRSIPVPGLSLIAAALLPTPDANPALSRTFLNQVS